MQALIDYNSQHLPEFRLLYHNSTRCKWIFSHNLNFLRKKPFIFIKNYTFYFGKYITTYYLLMCRILQFPICVATETPLRIVVVGLPESIFQTRSRFSNFIPEPSSFNDSVALYSTPGSGSVACEVYNRQSTSIFPFLSILNPSLLI